MLSQAEPPRSLQIESRHIDRFVPYARNPRKNDAAVDRRCASIREFGFKVPVLARSDGTVVDGHLRIRAARKLGSWPGGDINGIPVILCDEWTEAQVKAFRLMVNRSVTWAAWDEELLALELQDLQELDFDLDLTGFNPGEIDGLLAIPDEERATRRHRFLLFRYRVSEMFGSADCTASSAVMPRARKPSRVCSATASRC